MIEKEGRLRLEDRHRWEKDFPRGAEEYRFDGTGPGHGKNSRCLTTYNLFVKVVMNEIVVHECRELQYLLSMEIGIFAFSCGVITGCQVFPCYNPFSGRGEQLGLCVSF